MASNSVMKQLPSRVTRGNSHLQDHDYDPSYGKGTGKKNENDADFPTSHSILQYHIANSSLPIRRKYKKIKNKKDYSQ